MDEQVIARILDRLNKLERRAVHFRRGQMTGADPLTVDLGSSTVDVPGALPPADGMVTALVSGNHPPLVFGAIGARVTRGSQTIPDNTSTILDFDTMRVDTAGMWTGGPELTAPCPGLFLIGASVRWNGDADGSRLLELRVNGGPDPIDQDRRQMTSASEPAQNLATLWPLAAGDYVEARVLHGAGNDLSVLKVANSSPELWMARVM